METPIFRAVPSMTFIAEAMLEQLRSGCVVFAISSSCERQIVPAWPFADSPDSGYFSYYENGERKVFAASDGGPIHKDMWDDVMGRTGMAMDSPSQLNAKLAATNGWFRSVYTTYPIRLASTIFMPAEVLCKIKLIPRISVLNLLPTLMS